MAIEFFEHRILKLQLLINTTENIIFFKIWLKITWWKCCYISECSNKTILNCYYSIIVQGYYFQFLIV